MALITPESPNLTNYLYDWAYEEERDFLPGWEWKARSCWSTLPVTRWLNAWEGFMNSDYQETYALTPVTYRFLTPETDCLFQMGDYPEKAFKMAGTFLQNI